MIVTRWTGLEVRALREIALRKGLEPFALMAGVGESTVRKWERATQERPVKGESAELLDTVLAKLTDDQLARFRAAMEEAGLMAVSAEPVVSPERGEEAEVKRRQFGFAAGAALLASSFAPSDTGLGDARLLAQSASKLEQREQVIGGMTLLEEAVGLLRIAENRIETGTFEERAGREYLSATGTLALIAGWLAYDADMHDLARNCYYEAFSMANQAGNDELTVQSCLYLAHLTIHLGRTGRADPHRALNLVSRARDLTRGRPPGRLHALIATREAQAQAVIGDAAAFGKAVATAWRELDFALSHEAADECPYWIRFVTATEVRFQEARGFGDLGKVKKSADLSGGLALEHAGARNTANYRAGWAASLVKVGDITGAVEQGLLVLEDLEKSVSSPRTLRELQPVRAAARDSEGFDDRFDQLVNRQAHT
ncbi:hypothetical protein [Nocardia sp. NPDC048505]|uniref:hypothetical protein n=1 Tax=unclassified Nocardia TaxID=2637762 RepID=UPI00340F9239